MKKSLVIFGLAMLMVASVQAAELTNDKSKVSYIVGYQIGQQLKNDGMDIDTQALLEAIEDAMGGKEARLSRDEMQEVMSRYQQQRSEKLDAAAMNNQKAGQQFLAENVKKPGVKELDNGLQYKVVKAGSGKKPSATDTVTVHYRGTLIDGTEFDSSYKRGEPAEFPVNRVIAGWTQILQMMPEGAQWQVFIPSELAYGESGAGGVIGPNSTLIFDIELIKVN